MLIPIENVLSKAEVQEFRSVLANSDWRDGVETAGTLAKHVKRNLQLDDESAQAIQLGNIILRKLARNPQFISAALPNKIYPPKFNCYQNGGTYGVHVDSAIMQIPNSAMSVRSDLSATLFLAEPDEYEGGELQIESPFGIQSVKLEAGDMVLYPSSSLHQVTPVTKGARIASFFWIQSMVQSETDRTMLYDLDMSIQELTALDEGRNPAALVKLTGIYHNLLRRWATT